MEGVVDAAAEGETVLLNAGFGTSASPGQAPSEPTKIPQAPELAKVASLEYRLPVTFNWKGSQHASQYRVQLLAGPNYQELIHEAMYSGNQAVVPELPDADYLVRVKSVGQNGLEGIPAEQSFLLDAHPYPPVIKSPIDGAVNKRKKTRFFWEPNAEAANYYFQVSDTNNFGQILSEVKKLPGNMNGISIKLKSGSYYWRIASIDKNGEQGPFGEVQDFIVDRKR